MLFNRAGVAAGRTRSRRLKLFIEFSYQLEKLLVSVRVQTALTLSMRTFKLCLITYRNMFAIAVAQAVVE